MATNERPSRLGSLVQLDELRTRLRSHKQGLWLWLAIDPCTKLLPVLHLGPRSQNSAHTVIHSLRPTLAPGCIPLFTSDGLNLYFYALTAHFGHWLHVARRGRKILRWQVAEELIYGQVKKSYLRRKLVRVTHVMRLGTKDALTVVLQGLGPLWTAQHGLYRTGSTDGPSWNSRAGASHLGHGEASPAPLGPPGMVASLLPLGTSSCITAGEARAATRTRWQAGGATRPPAYGSSGFRQNHSTMDGARSALIPLASGFRLSGKEVRGGCSVISRGDG